MSLEKYVVNIQSGACSSSILKGLYSKWINVGCLSYPANTTSLCNCYMRCKCYWQYKSYCCCEDMWVEVSCIKEFIYRPNHEIIGFSLYIVTWRN